MKTIKRPGHVHLPLPSRPVRGTFLETAGGFVRFFVVDEGQAPTDHPVSYTDVVLREEVCPVCANGTSEKAGAVMLSKATLLSILDELRAQVGALQGR